MGLGELEGWLEFYGYYIISDILQNSSIINTFKINKFYYVKLYLNKAQKNWKKKKKRKRVDIILLFHNNNKWSQKRKWKWKSLSRVWLQPHGLYSPWNSPSQSTGVGSLSLLQGIFPSQGSNPGLPRGRQILYQLRHQGSPNDSKLPIKSRWVFPSSPNWGFPSLVLTWPEH